jgi:SAM-dependent methyltransferase
MNLDNQSDYWDKVAGIKTFTHPINLAYINQFLNKQSSIVDYGCGYGRIVKQLIDEGFQNVCGFDTSKALIKRGITENNLPLNYIENSNTFQLEDNSVDCILLFAVLTCIPSNEGQKNLVKSLHTTLKKGGILYISDYYLQKNSPGVNRYQYLYNDQDNFGVFTLPEGATFRHHTKEWIKTLIKDMQVVTEDSIIVKTMNGHTANGFQLIARK